MKICPFYDQLKNSPHRYLYSGSIHLHVHCSNTHLIRIRDQSNTNISTALQYLGIFFTHSPYPHNLGHDPFRTFLCYFLHQYDNNTHLYTTIPDRSIKLQLYKHSIVAPRTHHNITTRPIVWKQLRPAITPECSDYRTYSHGLTSSLPPANYIRVSINFIDHTYIGVLPRSAHATIHRYFSTSVQQ